MNIRLIEQKDFNILKDAKEETLCRFGEKVHKWQLQGFISGDNCYVFEDGDSIILGGICFDDNASSYRTILDFVVTDSIENPEELLIGTVNQTVNPLTIKISYSLYNNTEQFLRIKNIFLQAGFTVEQESRSYSYTNKTTLPDFDSPLNFKNFKEMKRSLFVQMVEGVTIDTLESLMAADAARMGSYRAAEAYVNALAERDYDPALWKIGYLEDEPIGLFITRRLEVGKGSIDYFGVLPDYRGKGYCVHFLAEATKTLLEKGITEIFGDVDIANKPVANALEELGYVFKYEKIILVLKMK